VDRFSYRIVGTCETAAGEFGRDATVGAGAKARRGQGPDLGEPARDGRFAK
jgi:hypothetical protein